MEMLSCLQPDKSSWLLGANGNSITDPGLYVDLVTAGSLTPAQEEEINSISSLAPDAYADSATVCSDSPSLATEPKHSLMKVANPFWGISPLSYQSAGDQQLFLLDGGAAEPNITNVPMWPMIQPSRKIDVIFAIDDSVSPLFAIVIAIFASEAC